MRSNTRANYRRSSFSRSYGGVTSYMEKNPHLRRNKVKSNPVQNFSSKGTISSQMKSKFNNSNLIERRQIRNTPTKDSHSDMKFKNNIRDRTLLPENRDYSNIDKREMSVAKLNELNHNVNIIRRDIQGKHGKYNTFYSRLPIPFPGQGSVVFFMGDDVSGCKDLPEEAERLAQPLEVLQSLSKKFPTNSVSIHVVQPSRYSSGGYAVYENFFQEEYLGKRGDPVKKYSSENLPAASQLAKLLGEECHKPIIIMGFSKGGIVSMQLLAELSNLSQIKGEVEEKLKTNSVPRPRSKQRSTRTSIPTIQRQNKDQLVDKEAVSLLENILAIHFVDAGTSSPVEFDNINIKELDCGVYFHGTPRQWDDPSREWLIKDRDRIANGVAKIENYFEDKNPEDVEESLVMHFGIIDALRI